MRTRSTLLLALGLQMLGTLAISAESEKRLLFLLLDNYGSNARPVANASQAVPVKVGLALIRINDVHQESQTLSIATFLAIMWQDDFLKWDPAEFGGIDRIAVDPSTIWKPDLELFNAVDHPKELTSANARLVVKSDGGVINVRYQLLTTSCPSDAAADIVTCKLVFGSWVYDSSLIELKALAANVDTNDYEQHRKWEVLRTSAHLNLKQYDCCPDDTYSDVTYSLTLKRRSRKTKQPVQSSGETPRGHVVGVAAILAAILVGELL